MCIRPSTHIPTRPNAHPTRSDKVLRNVAILALFLTVVLTFLSVVLRLSIVLVGLLIPAWRTFKAIEAPSSAAPLHVTDVTDEAPDDDPDWLPEPEHRRHVSPPSSLNTRHATLADPPANAVALRNWQTYWVMAALLFAADAVLRPILAAVLPGTLYTASIFSAVAWLTRRDAANAADLYAGVVRPIFRNSERNIDRVASKMLGKLDHATATMVVAINDLVAPIAKQIERAAERGSRQVEYAAVEGARQFAEAGHGRRRFGRRRCSGR